MKVKCIEDHNGDYSITIGKEYETKDETGFFYHIINDNEELFPYPHSCFEIVGNKVSFIRQPIPEIKLEGIYTVKEEFDIYYVLWELPEFFFLKEGFKKIGW
jgi:hypothetical protein